MGPGANDLMMTTRAGEYESSGLDWAKEAGGAEGARGGEGGSMNAYVHENLIKTLENWDKRFNLREKDKKGSA